MLFGPLLHINTERFFDMPIPVIVLISVLCAILFLFLIFVFLIKPNRYRKEMDDFKNVRYAHRGLHDQSRPENSMSAFSAAVEGGYGIELDVRLSSDGELMVFHDDTLDRVTNESGRVDARSAEELKSIHLMNSEDTIPTFREVLELVDGKVPLLIELKEDAGKYGVTEKTLEILKDYSGPFIIESFNPLALGRVKKLDPHIMRGFLSQNFYKEKKYRKLMYFLLEHLLLNVICRPDFIAYCHSDFKMPALRLTKKLFRVPLIAWTVENAEDDEMAIKNGFSGIIFQHYLPEKTVSEK